MIFDKSDLLLYAITNRKDENMEKFYNDIELALMGGVTLLQLREKNLDEDKFIKEAIRVKSICDKYNVPLIINDNVKVAIKSKANGVHVGITDCPVDEIRKKVGDDFIIGATAKTVEQAKLAQSAGANYLGVGAVFPSPTKTNVVRITNDILNDICSSVSIPCVAIGGINMDNVEALKGSNINGVAVVSAIFSASDIEGTTKKLKEKVKKVIS